MPQLYGHLLVGNHRGHLAKHFERALEDFVAQLTALIARRQTVGTRNRSLFVNPTSWHELATRSGNFTRIASARMLLVVAEKSH